MSLTRLAVMWERESITGVRLFLTEASVFPEGKMTVLSWLQLLMLTYTAHGWGWWNLHFCLPPLAVDPVLPG